LEPFVARLLDRTIRVEADLVDQLFNSSEKRLTGSCYLWPISARKRNPGQSCQNPPEPLAETIGTTRSHVSFFVNKFRRLDFIHKNGNIEVHSPSLHVALRDDPKIKT
jgi:hypothetical protein